MTLDELMAQASAVRVRIAELAAQGPRSMAFRAGGGGSVVVSPDASKPGRWRATRIDAAGEPTGHMEAPDIGAALKVAHECGADLFSPLGR
jgi:hypothetical protein